MAIVLVALALRALPLTAGLPYTSYVDEHITLRPVARVVADGTWEPGFYSYPTLTIYATAAVSAVLDVLPGGGSVASGARATLRQPFDSNVLSTDLILAGRLAVLVFSTGTVLMAALLAAHLRGRRAGVIAALLTATMPALVSRSAIVIVDTPATFFTTASLLCASYVGKARRAILWALMAGAAAGLAAAAKYPAVVVILAVLAVIALSGERSLRDRLAMACASLAACAVAAVIAAPTLVLRTREVFDALSAQSDFYRTTTTTTYWHELFTGKEVGALLLVVAVVGCLELLRSARTRPLMIGYLVFALALVASIGRYSFQPFRNVLPLLPFLGVAAAVGIVATVDALGRFAHLSRWSRAALVGATGLALCAAMIASAARFYVDTRIDITNSRTQARQWLVDRVDPDDQVLVANELAFLPSELARIPAQVTVRSLTTTQNPVDTRAFEYVVVGDYPSAKNWRPSLVDRRIAVRYGERVATLTNPRGYRSPHQIVRVFDARGTQDIQKCFPFCG